MGRVQQTRRGRHPSTSGDVRKTIEKRGSAKSFKFLELPGELRNRIYGLIKIPAKPYKRIQPLASSTSTTKPTVKTLAPLAQACRQLREECGPIHYQQARYVVKWSEIPHFFRAFYPSTLDDKSILPRSVKILVDDPTKPMSRNEDSTIDVLPLLQLKAYNQALKVAIVPDPEIPRHDKKELTNLKKLMSLKNIVWWNSIRDREILAVIVHRKNGRLTVRIVIDPACAPKYVIEDVRNGQGENRFLQQLGFAVSYTLFVTTELDGWD